MIQEWFYLHPWAKILYFILGLPLVYYSLIYCLQRIDRMIVRPPLHWADSSDSMQGLRSREEIKCGLILKSGSQYESKTTLDKS